MIRYARILLGLLAGILLAAGGVSAGAAPLKVFVTIAPEVWLTQRIGGDRVTAEALVRPGQVAESYQPTPRQIAALAQSDLFFRIRMPFEEAWIGRIREMNPRLRIVDITAGIKRRKIEAHVHPGGEAPEEHAAHAREGLDDPHVWLDPILAKQLAANIAAALVQADPAGKSIYDANLKQLDADLDRADGQIRQILTGLKSRQFMIYHPALGYFADRYGLKQIPIQIEGKDPTARALAEIIDQAQKENIRVIFVQRQFGMRSAQVVAQAIGGQVETIDDLSPDYLNNLLKIARAIAGAGSPPAPKA